MDAWCDLLQSWFECLKYKIKKHVFKVFSKLLLNRDKMEYYSLYRNFLTRGAIWIKLGLDTLSTYKKITNTGFSKQPLNMGKLQYRKKIVSSEDRILYVCKLEYL